ncbi:MAG TPA: hypothetical protein VLT58_03975, partial [Polyangia bacterium]|nr:hypothetical protein [Polyangia bacterium]
MSGAAAARRSWGLPGTATATLGVVAGVRVRALVGTATTARAAAGARAGAVAGSATVGAGVAASAVIVDADVAPGVRFDGARARKART